MVAHQKNTRPRVNDSFHQCAQSHQNIHQSGGLQRHLRQHTVLAGQPVQRAARRAQPCSWAAGRAGARPRRSAMGHVERRDGWCVVEGHGPPAAGSVSRAAYSFAHLQRQAPGVSWLRAAGALGRWWVASPATWQAGRLTACHNTEASGANLCGPKRGWGADFPETLAIQFIIVAAHARYRCSLIPC